MAFTKGLSSFLFPNIHNQRQYSRPESQDEEDHQSPAANLFFKEDDRETITSIMQPSYRVHTWIIVNITMFIFSVGVLSHGLYTASTHYLDHHSLLKQTSSFSPVLEQLDVQTFMKQMDGALFQSDHPSIYRDALAPNPTVDKAWEDLEIIHTFPITESDILVLGKDPSISVKYPASYNLGSSAYVAQIDVFHQLHCLNALRTTAWASHPSNNPTRKHQSDLHWLHIAHCVDMLRQSLMCTASLDVLTFNWMETQEYPFPDFYINRQCRDWDAIVRWHDEKSVNPRADNEGVWMSKNFTRPADGEWKEVEVPEEYWAVMAEKQGEIHV